jgi:hypothetical protein
MMLLDSGLAVTVEYEIIILSKVSIYMSDSLAS